MQGLLRGDSPGGLVDFYLLFLQSEINKDGVKEIKSHGVDFGD